MDNIRLKENEYYIHWKNAELRNIAETSKSADEKAVQIMNDISAVYKLVEKDTN